MKPFARLKSYFFRITSPYFAVNTEATLAHLKAGRRELRTCSGKCSGSWATKCSFCAFSGCHSLSSRKLRMSILSSVRSEVGPTPTRVTSRLCSQLFEHSLWIYLCLLTRVCPPFSHRDSANRSTAWSASATITSTDLKSATPEFPGFKPVNTPKTQPVARPEIRLESLESVGPTGEQPLVGHSAPEIQRVGEIQTESTAAESGNEDEPNHESMCQ